MKFRSMFKVRKPGNGNAFQQSVERAGHYVVKVTNKVNKLVKSSVKV